VKDRYNQRDRVSEGCRAVDTKERVDYVLVLKKNQGTLHEAVEQYFGDQALRAGSVYYKVVDKARSAVEVREYWQTQDIGWLGQRKEWTGLSSIVMRKNTITKGDKSTIQTSYFINSLQLDVEQISRAILRHWMMESYHCTWTSPSR